MTSAQTVYSLVFSIYLLFFLLFARFFVWKNYSEKNYWNKRLSLSEKDLLGLSESLGKRIPHISILVPARNESVVIENTIRHLVSLKYPKDFLEILVVTDEKEILGARNERKSTLEEAQKLIGNSSRGSPNGTDVSQKTRDAVIAVLCDFALREFLSKRFEDSCSLGIPELSLLPARERQIAVRDISLEIINCKGAPKMKTLRDIVKVACPWLSELDIDRVYPAALAVSMPVLAAYTQIFDGANHSVLKKAINRTARANHELTQDIILRMTEFIASKVATVLKTSTNTELLKKKLLDAVMDMHPTTQEIVAFVQEDLNRQRKTLPKIKHVVVPFDFDGCLGGSRIGTVVPSTKGRALNWGLKFLDSRSEICGFYDAESRPHEEVLLYVGYRRLLEPEASRLLQGLCFK